MTVKFSIALFYTQGTDSRRCRYDGIRYGMRNDADSLKSMYMQTRGQGLGAEVKRRILMGTYALSAGYYDAFYKKAQQVRSSNIFSYKR